MEPKKKSLVIPALALNLSLTDIQEDREVKFENNLLPFILCSASWTFILTQMVFVYKNIEGWLQITLTILYAFLYSSAFLVVVAFLSSLFISSVKGFNKRFYFGLLVNLPVFAIALISIIMKIQIGVVKVLGYFPEHALIFGAYLTIFSHVRFVAVVGRIRAIAYIFILSILVYILLGPLMFELFKL